MKVNVSFTLTDEQRNWISLQRNSRARKRLATRDEVRRFIMQAVAKTGLPPTIKEVPDDTAA